MQSNLQSFTDNPESTESIDQPTAAAADAPPVFTGKLPRSVIDAVARHMTGAFEYVFLDITPDGLTVKPYIEDDGKNMLSQTVTISAGEWESFDLTHDRDYVAAVDPYTSLYKAMTDSDESDMVTISITPATDSEAMWESLKNHALYEPVTDADDSDPAAIDMLTVAGTETEILRHPSRDPLDVDSLNYHASCLIDSAYDAKQWLSQAGENNDDPIILVCLTAGDRRRVPEYLLTFTEVETDSWEPIGESLHLSANSTELSGESNDLSDVTVGGTRSHPSATIQQCLPDDHDGAVQVAWGFYRLTPLNGMFKHLLKDTLTDGRFELEMSLDFPLQITHDIDTAVDVETDATVTNMLAPVVSPE